MKLARRVRARGAVASALVLLLAGAAGAGSPVPYGGGFREEIDATFFELEDGPLGRVSASKLQSYRDFIEKKKRVLATHVYNEETLDRGRSELATQAKIQELDINIALDHVLDLLRRMEQTSDRVEAYHLAAEALMVEYATRSYTDHIGSVKIPIHLKNMTFEWRVDSSSRARQADEEATNLVDPETGEFYTPDELAALIRKGVDISRLNPPDQTPFWEAVEDISQVDIVSNYLEGGDPVHAGSVSEFPPFDSAVFELQKAHMTQSKPKLDVYYADEACAAKSRKKQKKCRERIKLKFGMETHADPTANALLSALGFNVDVSMHLKNVRVNLGDYPMEALERDWIGYFDRQRVHTYFPLHTVLHEGEAGHGRDADGEYIVFQESVAELKPPEAERIGFFTFSSGMAAWFREARGLFVFNAWIANADMKDEENNKVILKKNAGGEMQMYLVQQDIGHAMGRVLPERPEAFPWDLVETHAGSRVFGWANRSIEFNYINLQDNGLERTTTYADAKWMVRLIAQLTRKQIEDAVALGHWPGGIPELYVEKLLNRRNQLVQAFDLESEFELLAVDRHLTTKDGSVVDGRLVQNRWEGSPINFGHYWQDMYGPIGEFFIDRGAMALQAAISAIDVINPGNIRIEGKLRVLPRILAHLSREVILNPEPEGAFDQYVVVDTMEVGLRVGVGYIGSVEGTLVKKYSLAYPVRTQREGIRHGVGVVNFLLPYDVRKGKLPERFVLLREHAIKSGFRVSSDHSSFMSPFGIDADQNWVFAHRSVIDNRGEDPIVWVDDPRYVERAARLFLELAVLQIPFLGGQTTGGALSGEVWTLDGSKREVAGDDGVPIFEKMVTRADFRDYEKILLGEPRRAESEFESRGAWWNLLFASWRTRTSEELVTVKDLSGRTLRQERQAERRRWSSWTFLDNGETQEFKVTGFLGGKPGSGGDEAGPHVVASFAVDDLNTHSDEFDSYYDLLLALGAGESYLSEEFEAADWEVSGRPDGRWTRLLTEGTVHLRSGALARLTRIDRAGYWRLLARNLELTEREFRREMRLMQPSASKSTLSARRSISGRRVRSIIRRSRAILNLLERAESAGSPEERMRLIVQALYRSSFRNGDTYDPIVLSTLLEQSGVSELANRNELVITARVSKAFEDEHNLPERRDVVGRLGSEPDFEQVDYRMFPFGGIDVYNMLDWVREIE